MLRRPRAWAAAGWVTDNRAANQAPTHATEPAPSMGIEKDMERFIKWIRARITGARPETVRATKTRGTPVLPGGLIPEERRRPALVADQQDLDPDATDELKLAEEPGAKPEPEPGFDPYNTGSYDRSNNWSRRLGK